MVRYDRQWRDDNCQHIKKGGGVGMYINDGLAYSTESLKEYNSSSKDIECYWVEIIMKNSKNIIVGVVYRPPGGNVELFCERLTTSLEEIGVSHSKDIFLLGDVNINYLAANDGDRKQLLQMESFTGLKQIVKQPTRLQNCIDLIFTNCIDVFWGNATEH